MAAASPPAQIVKPSRHIRDRVGKTGGPPLTEIAKRASILTDKLVAGFETEANAALLRLEAAVRQAQGGNLEGVGTQLYDAAHDIRGSAGSFGYPLAGQVCDAFCKFLESRAPLQPGDLTTVTLYVQAVAAIFRQKLTADGGAMGRELQALLARLSKA